MERLVAVGLVWLAVVGAGCQRGAAPSAAARPARDAAPVGTPAVAAVSRHGAALDGAPTVTLEALLTDPAPHVGKIVTLEGPVRQACTRKGCWMEIAPTAEGPGVRVRFKDYGFFVPTDAAGSTARAEGEIGVAELSEDRAAHWASEGARILRGPDGKAREVQLVATGVELRRQRP